MSARIYQPTRNAMQSGQGKTKKWILEFSQSEVRNIDPLMGWTSSGDIWNSNFTKLLIAIIKEKLKSL